MYTCKSCMCFFLCLTTRMRFFITVNGCKEFDTLSSFFCRSVGNFVDAIARLNF